MKRIGFLDENDWKLLEELQKNAQSSCADLAQKIGLSKQAVRRRKLWLEQVGIISGYRVEVDPKKLGLVVSAILRISVNGNNVPLFRRVIESSPEVDQCDRVIGNDSFIIKVLVRSTEHLEAVIDRFAPLGRVLSTVVTSSPVKRLGLTKALAEIKRDDGVR